MGISKVPEYVLEGQRVKEKKRRGDGWWLMVDACRVSMFLLRLCLVLLSSPLPPLVALQDNLHGLGCVLAELVSSAGHGPL